MLFHKAPTTTSGVIPSVRRIDDVIRSRQTNDIHHVCGKIRNS